MIYLELAVRGRVSVGGHRKDRNPPTRPNFTQVMGENAMAFQDVPNVAEVTLVYTQNLETITNTFHAYKAGGYDQADIDSLANKIDNQMPAGLLVEMSQDCYYERTEVRGLTIENDLFGIDGTNNSAGDKLVDGLPNNVTLSLKKISGFTGRSARGRWYCVGIPEDALASNENVYDPLRVDGFIAGVEAARIGCALAGWAAVIVSRYTGGVLRPYGETFPWVQTVAVNNNVDTQRRRLTK